MDDQLGPIGQPPEEIPEPTEPFEGELEPGAPLPEEPKPSGQDKLRVFLATPKGKAIAVGAVAAVVVVLAAVGFLFASSMSAPQKPVVTGTTTGAPAGGGESTATTQGGGGPSAETTGEGGLPQAFEVFENRDPFKPLIVAQPQGTSSGGTSTSSEATATGTEESEGSGSGGSSSGGGSGSSGSTSTSSITLEDITTVGGEYYAVLVYGGKTYTVTSGDRIDSSPWEVVYVGSSSVTLTYGDEQVTLTLGSSVTMR